MRSLPTPLALLLTLTALLGPALQAPKIQAQDTPGRVVLVLPFDNRSGNPSLSWIGDSFPDTLDKRLNSAGFLTISRDDRAYALDHLGLPVGFKPSRATTIRIAQQLDANYVIVGSYNIQQAPSGATSDHIDIQAQVLDVAALKLSPALQDSAQLNRLFDAENSIAWKVARTLDPHFNISLQTFLSAPGNVPLPAFEDYIRGANAPTDTERLARLKAAVNISPDYAAALLALGKQQYASRDFDAASATLAKVPAYSQLALEANFYLGLSRFNSAAYDAAAQAFHFVDTRLPLPEVVNDEGVALSRQGKDGAPLFQQASASDPTEEDYHYNLALALFRRGETSTALQQADAALKIKPADNEAIELRTRLNLVPPGTRLTTTSAGSFSPVERIRRNYSEAGYRQAAFQLAQMRDMRLATLPAAQRASEYTMLGQQAFAQNQLPEAESAFQSAISADPNSAQAHTGLAQVRESSNNPQQAREEALTSLRLQPNATAYLVLARLDLAENLLAASATDVSQALHLEPQNAAAQALKQTLQQRGQTIP